MRLLFVSGTSVGGAARSTYELASALEARGHTAATLMRIDEAVRRAYLHKRLVNLAVKLGEEGAAARFVEAIASRIGHAMRRAQGRGPHAWRAAIPENALASALRATRPDVVVVNSVEPRAWRRIHAALARRGIPGVLYMREATALRHLEEPVAAPDLLLSNAQGHAEAAEARGWHAVVIPSLVDLSRCRVESSRERVVLVNPRPEHGLDVALALSRSRPDVPFTLVESWPLDAREVSALRARIDGLANVEVQRFDPDPRRVYERARVLLVPYDYAGRPRVVLEAQANGIPVIAAARPGPAEAVGPGGLLVDPAAPAAAWAGVLARVWDDESEYRRLSAEALSHASRAEVDPEEIVTRFEEAISALLQGGADR